MDHIDDLILRHVELRGRVAQRDQIKKQRRAAFEAELAAELQGEWGTPEVELEEVRTKLKGLAEAMPNRTITSNVGQVLLEDRQLTWEVTDLGAFAKWAVDQKQADNLLSVQQGNIRKVCEGLKLAGMSLPEGTAPKITTILEVKSAGPIGVESQ